MTKLSRDCSKKSPTKKSRRSKPRHDANDIAMVAASAPLLQQLSPETLEALIRQIKANEKNKEDLDCSAAALDMENQNKQLLLSSFGGGISPISVLTVKHKGGGVSDDHVKRQSRIMDSFLVAVAQSNMPELAQVTVHNDDPTENHCPAIFNYLKLQGSSAKQFLNQLLIRVFLSWKDEDKTPYAPSTVATNLRTLFATFKRHGIHWAIKDFDKWTDGGGCIDVVNACWDKYLADNPLFGKKQGEQFTGQDFESIRLFIASLSQKQRKDWLLHIVYFAIVTQMGLRRRAEHRELNLRQFSFGHYPCNAGAGLAGKEYVQFDGDFITKTSKLTVSNPNATFNRNGGTRFIVDMEDPVNLGHALKDLLDSIHPDQTAVYRKRLSKAEAKIMHKNGYPNVLFSPLCPTGKNTISEYLPNLARAAGITNWKAKKTHALHAYMLTKRANDPTMNPAETAKLAYHPNIASPQQDYIGTSDFSAAEAVKALSSNVVPVQGTQANQFAPSAPSFVDVPFAPSTTSFVGVPFAQMTPTFNTLLMQQMMMTMAMMMNQGGGLPNVAPNADGLFGMLPGGNGMQMQYPQQQQQQSMMGLDWSRMTPAERAYYTNHLGRPPAL